MRAEDLEWIDENGEVHTVSSRLDLLGIEWPDPVPVAPIVGSLGTPTLAQMVQRMVRSEIGRVADVLEFDTADEADDFFIEDDPVDPLTPYEEVFNPPAAAAAPAPLAATGGAPEGAPPSSSQTSSSGSVSELSAETKVGKLIDAPIPASSTSGTGNDK